MAIQGLVPNVSPLTNVLFRMGEDKRAEEQRQMLMAEKQQEQMEAANIANFLTFDDPDSFMLHAQELYKGGQLDDEDYDELLQAAALPKQQRDMFLSNVLTATGYGDLVPNRLSGRGSNFAPTGSEDPNLYEDAGGNLFKMRTVYDPNTDTYGTRITDIQGLGVEPEGQLKIASKKLLTATQDAEAIALIESAKEEAKQIASLGQAADQEQQKKLGALRGDIEADEVTRYRNSQSSELSLGQLERALDQLDNTGKTTLFKRWAGQYLPGVDVSDEEAFESLAAEFALQELAKQSGTKTDFDFLKTAETQLQLGNTKAANRMILNRLKERQDYNKERYQAYRQFKRNNKDVENFDFEYELPTDVQVNPELKASYDALSDEQKQIFLQKATPEQKAQVGVK